ncbi:glyoxylase I 4 [Vigna angularis]|uniref:glyoxylase I 4 n=1 Tax=Phaseolus angularis TaxID=3914 RepID=UPI0022B4023A|nr:glyoxylase I 4 [Vigna angularis]
MLLHFLSSFLYLDLHFHLFHSMLHEMKESVENPLHLKSVNHISLICTSVVKSINFYQNILGFFPIRRPGSLDFDGAWLFGYGIGIHLLQVEDPSNIPRKKEINPKDNHISFQCESMGAVEKKLEEMEIEYARATVEEGGIKVDQLFFHDPDGFMIEICNCDILPVIPLASDMVRSCSRMNLQMLQQRQIHQIVKQDSAFPSGHTKIQNAFV